MVVWAALSSVPVVLIVQLGCACAGANNNLSKGKVFKSCWPVNVERVWVGPDYWSNRLQDWRICNGRLECVHGGSDRNVHLLTCRVAERTGNLEMSVRLGQIDRAGGTANQWAGFRLGARTEWGDYRRYAIYGKGIDAGITASGSLFIGDMSYRKLFGNRLGEVLLVLRGKQKNEEYELTLSAYDAENGKKLCEKNKIVDTAKICGNVALVCHQNKKSREFRCWFDDLVISGNKIELSPEREFGPILFAQHTLSRGVLNMTAQMPPLGTGDSKVVKLEIKESQGGSWKKVGESQIDELSRTASFRVTDWQSQKDIHYRLVYKLKVGIDKERLCYYEGTVRREPLDRDIVSVAAFTGNNDLGFPNNDIVAHLKWHNPDMLVFTGDQIYERVGGYGFQREPTDKACLDYLRKWYLVGWSFGELMRDRPTICLPDDHDVYHGNLWGAGGRKAKGFGKKWQDKGGYMMPAEWVNMVQRTQTSHLPEPYDARPVEQGIEVYYCAVNYGGISFAVIEDRKFKSAPSVLLPEAGVSNGWFLNPDFDPAKESDVEGAKLLGKRQLDFLNDWASDWSGGAKMKAVISQTILSSVSTFPAYAKTSLILAKLGIPEPGEYPANERPKADADTNGWPPGGRNRALRIIRKCFAFHIAGDQHLGSVTHYGVDTWGDAGFAFCVPAVANVWPRRWFPSEAGANRLPGSPRYTGQFRDGFGNFVTVHAVSNPVVSDKEPARLYDRATGYGIVRFNKDKRTICVECWPRYSDPRNPAPCGQYPGWPMVIQQSENYGREDKAYLPMMYIKGQEEPVVQIIDESNGEIVYTLRIKGRIFRPKVFAEGKYTVKISYPDADKTRTFGGIEASKKRTEMMVVSFNK